MAKKFNYVVAHPWEDTEDSNLCIYTYFDTVHQGSSKEEAREMLEYVKRRSGNENWAIYKVKFTKVE